MEVKVDPDRVKDLYRTLFDERNSAGTDDAKTHPM